MNYAEDANYAQTLGRALDILELFKTGTPLSLTEVAKHLGLSSTVTFRLLHTLCVHGYLSQAKDKTYTIGDSAVMLGIAGLYERRIIRASHNLIWDWYLQTGHTVGVNIVVNRCAINVDKISPLQDEIDIPYVARPLPLHRGATQRVLLAFLAEEERNAYVESLFMQRNAKDELLKQLESIREQGYDYTAEQVTKGIWAISMPVFEADGALAGSIGTAGYISDDRPKDLEQRLDQLRQLVERVQKNMDSIK